jgi:hypothetical protein
VLVFIAGMPRSGSTFSFNVVRDLLRQRGTIYQESTANLLSAVERSGNAEHVLCKGHDADEVTLRLVELGVVKAVCTVRRPEDAIASGMECFGDNLDVSIASVWKWLVMFERLRGRSLIVCYEQIEIRAWLAALRIARHLCLDCSRDEIDHIVNKYSKENVIKMADTLPIDDARVHDLGHTYYDQETFFHRGHVCSLESRPATERIGANAVSHIRGTLASYIDERGDLRSLYGELQQEVRAALSLLTPMKVLNCSKIRVGGKHDGGYVMINDLDSGGVCYSVGVGRDSSWDLDMAQRGWTVYQYDHTVDCAPSQHPNCHFHPIGIAPTDDAPNMKRLDTLVRENGHLGRTDMILKMDIEGHEWDCLGSLEGSFLGQFEQFVLEIHWMDHLISPEFLSRFTKIIGAVRRTHECVHIHANNFAEIIPVRGIPIAQVYELTFARRDKYAFIENDEHFPSNFDSPNNQTVPDYYLGLFKF